MVYAAKEGRKPLTLGVSGRLLDSNLVMWDPETNSLWSQLTGEAIHGKLKGQRLRMLPAVFVGLGTWKRMHPDTVVLDLPPVRRRAWHYTTRNLAEAANEHGEALGLGVRSGSATLAVSLKLMQSKKVVVADVGGTPLLFVWVEDGRAPLVYRATLEGRKVRWRWKDGALVGKAGRFDPLTGRSRDARGVRLQRSPYVPTVLKAWRTFYPKGRVLD